MHRTSLGDFELTILSDGLYYLDGGAMFGVVPKPMWEKKMPADAMNRLHLGMNSLLIRTGDHNILVETGAGDKLPDKVQKIFDNEARLMASFEEAGVSPDEIDIVINTHLHFDHCGWNTRRAADGRIVPTFPRATYYYQQGELAHAHRQHERDRVSYLTENYDPLVASGQAHLLNGNADIVPGVRVELYPGHTANHQAVLIESKGKKAAYVGDLIPTSAHVHPTWVMGYDLYPLDCIDNKKRYYEESLPERWLTIFTHDPQTPWAYLTKDDQGRIVAEPVKEEAREAQPAAD